MIFGSCHFLFFQFTLRILIGPAHHGKPVITDSGCHIVLIEADEETVSFCNTPLVLFQLLLINVKYLSAFAFQPGLTDFPEMTFIVACIPDDFLKMFPDHLLQNDRPDEMGRTRSGIAAAVRTDKMILSLFEMADGTVVYRTESLYDIIISEIGFQ